MSIDENLRDMLKGERMLEATIDGDTQTYYPQSYVDAIEFNHDYQMSLLHKEISNYKRMAQ